MVYDPEDTIAAVGTASGAASRGMVRLSGPTVLACLQACFRPVRPSVQLEDLTISTTVEGTLVVGDPEVVVPCELYYWPTQRSYTRQPTAELHTIGSPPLIECVLNRFLSCGARLAEPGEFTLRAFLAGRLDLTQAEAVLGVIDAQSDGDLQAALGQLAGGLSKPLADLREKLLFVLAELEAGLDFVDEDIEFITAERLRNDLTAVHSDLLELQEQLVTRFDALDTPRVVLSGPPNVGKSSLFNAFVKRFGLGEANQPALVANQSGTTRDFVSANLRVNGIAFELVDTAGVEVDLQPRSIDQMAQALAKTQRKDADVVITCHDTNSPRPNTSAGPSSGDLAVITKCDLLTTIPSWATNCVACSSISGSGLQELAAQIASRLHEVSGESGRSLSHTGSRCTASLKQADAATSRALHLVDTGGSEELVAAEVREALHSVGEVVGAVYTDDILDRVFGQFCIGK